MYESYYKLTGKPFQLAPDPFFFFGSSTHKRALAYLKYGLSQGEGFIVVTGDVGTGKSTLVRTLFGSLEGKDDVVAAELINTQLDSTDILRMVAATFGLAHKDNEKSSLLKNLENFFIARSREGKRCMLVVDEAQNLPFETIEELRMLSNLYYDGKTLLQIFLLGQSEFREHLRDPSLEQVRQRVTASYHLAHLDVEETQAYIEHRLKKVGWEDSPGFTAESFQLIYEFSEGVPRKINTTCDRLLLYGFLEEKSRIDGEIVKVVTSEITEENDAGKEAAAKSMTPLVREPTLSEDASVVEVKVHQLEREIQDLKKQFRKEREFMRKIVQISLNFDED
ncbi:XrtA/PEP-CTERM system-associated ATPase [Aliikangiella coralliicola]|uniref:AAA family ATPase n=1 Tax=Aliikangiella coralliicola TaxID=2592383 RepID=A0A545U4U0_9GAMM|nr:XrtA/PEP-CTERM system-associated ATPase [Aliikangiella coralliicola]TQV84423.1 AAA family ATPase [Aliikangiella coralliicola]